MHRASLLLVCALPFLSSCSLWPTGDDIDDAIAEELRYVDGPWMGETSGSNPIVLDFQLVQAGTQVQGSGTMREGANAPVSITVTGTFQRPALTLTFSGLVYEGRSVTGHLQTTYDNIVVSAPLELTATGYAQTRTVLLSED
jgi:hypothetical protein